MKSTSNPFQNRKTAISLAILMAIFCFAVHTNYAYALDIPESCTNLSENEEWTKGIQNLTKLIKNADFEIAQKEASNLEKTCKYSPFLNYLQGKAEDGLRNDDKALEYYKKASLYSREFSISNENEEKIWFARFEKEKLDLNEYCDTKIKSLLKSLQEEKKKTAYLLKERASEKHKLSTLLWTGTGLGISGLVFIGTGLGLALTADPGKYYLIPDYEDLKNSKVAITRSPKYIAGWILFGVGIPVTIAGAVLAGIYGYRYTMFTDDEFTFDIELTPGYASFSMVF